MLKRVLAVLAAVLVAQSALAFDAAVVPLQQAPATNTTQNYTVMGFGTPQCAKVIATSASAANTVTADLIWSVGFWDDGNNQEAVVYSDDDNVATTATSVHGSATEALVIVTAGTTTIVRSASVAATTDGVQLTWVGSQTSVRPQVRVTLYRGLADCQVGEVIVPNTIGATVSITGMSAAPNVGLFAWSASQSGIGTGDVFNRISVGVAVDDGSLTQRSAHAYSTDNVTTPVANGILRTNRVGGEQGGNRSGELTAWNSDGVTITKRDATAARDMAYLLMSISDADFKLASLDSPNSASADWNVTGVGFQPSYLLLGLTDVQTEDSQQGNEGVVGVFETDGAEESTLAVATQGFGAPTNSNSQSLAYDRLFFESADGTTIYDGHDLELTSDGFRIVDANLDVASATTHRFFYLAIGQAATTSAAAVRRRLLQQELQ
jgi:hypothetical protein